MRFNLLLSKVIPTSRFRSRLLPFGDGAATIFPALDPLPFLTEDFTVVRKISLALVLMTMAGVASAKGGPDKCFQFLFWTFCPPVDHDPPTVKAPEIDPASAMAGLTMLAGGLAVLRGRRRINSKD
jgi:hypothetical protein